MASKAIPLTEAQFVERLAANLGDFEYVGGKRGAQMWLREFKKTVAECVVEGKKVSLTGLVRFEPKYVPGKEKGELVRNPRTGETTPRAESIAPRFKVKAFASSAIGKQFPGTSTAAGKSLVKQLA